jgi:uncharacterized protein (DUF433 family)
VRGAGLGIGIRDCRRLVRALSALGGRATSSRIEIHTVLRFCGLDMNTINRITMNPGVCGGRPCIRGLRIRVRDVLDLLAAGSTREEILADYPDLEPEDITAVLEFAAR